MNETLDSDLTPEEQEAFDAKDTNYPFTANEIRKRVGAPHDPDPNKTVHDLIGASEAKKMVERLEESSRVRKEQEAADEEARRREENETLGKLIRGE